MPSHLLRLRSLSLCLFVVLLFTLSTACSPVVAPSTGEQASAGCSEISFMAAEYSAGMLDYWQNVANQFMTENPDMKVNIEIINWQQMHDTTAQRIAADRLPDLVNTATIWLPEWADSGAIQAIDPVITPELKERFFASMLEKGALYNGQNWGLPIAAGVRGMYWNKALFEQAGLDPEKPPTTWDELYDDAVTIHEKTGKFGFSFDGKGVQAFRSFGYFLWNAGGDLLTEDGKAAFNSPEGVAALEFMVKLAQSGAIPDPAGVTIEGDEEPMFIAGEDAMIITGGWLVGLIKNGNPDLQYGVSHVPVRDESVTPINWGVTDTLIMSKDACIPVATKFIEFMYRAENRTEFSKQVGDMPVTQDAATNPIFTDDPITAMFVDLLPTARFDPLDPNYSKMQEFLRDNLQLAYLGEKTPQQALDDAAAQFNEIVVQ
jgi:multiple sugar transport system substrate-binding protein